MRSAAACKSFTSYNDALPSPPCTTGVIQPACIIRENNLGESNAATAFGPRTKNLKGSDRNFTFHSFVDGNNPSRGAEFLTCAGAGAEGTFIERKPWVRTPQFTRTQSYANPTNCGAPSRTTARIGRLARIERLTPMTVTNADKLD